MLKLPGCNPKTPDRWALAIILGVFLLMTAVSLRRWCNPIIDGGREMNQPLRLLQGERLYADVYHLYGPLSPYLNAGLYKVFGAHLNTLYVSGWVAGLLSVGLVYGIARSWMAPLNATLAALLIIVLCIFKPAGNYIFPYSYAAVHATLFDLAAVACLVRYLLTDWQRFAALAGAFAGLALACKAEFGLAAGVTGLIILALRPGAESRFRYYSLGGFAGAFLLAAGLPYGLVFWSVPWESVIRDSYLLLYNLPPELIHFNQARTGMLDPIRALEEMIMAGLQLAAAAALIALTSLYTAQNPVADGALGKRYKIRLYGLVLLATAGLGVGWWFRQIPLDRSPYRVIPLVLVGLLWHLGLRLRATRREARTLSTQEWILLLLGVHSMAILWRVLLRVPTGGAYGGYLVLTPTLVLIHLVMESFPALFQRLPQVAQGVRRLTTAALLAVVITSAAVIAYRYRRGAYYRLETTRGVLEMRAEEGRAFRQALDFIRDNTQTDEPIFAAPEGSSLNFLAGRRTPQRYEIFTPGFLSAEAEGDAIRRLQNSRTRFVFLLNRPTPEFGPREFGRDYYTQLMGWIERRFHVRRVFGENPSPVARIGDRHFFIKVYERGEREERSEERGAKSEKR